MDDVTGRYATLYDDAGRKTQSEQANGTKATMVSDAANRMTGLVNLNSANTTLSYFNYVFDHVGDRTSVWDNGTDVSNWTYDFTGQLTNDVYRPATTPINWNGLTVHQWNLLSVDDWSSLAVDDIPTGGAGLLAYDPAGNRLVQTDPVTGDITTFAYDNCNQLLHGEDVSGLTTYTYDPNGNQETIEEPSGDITTNTWDGENRLVQVEHPSSDVTTYAVNGDGLRVSKDDGVAETRYVHDGNNVLLETDDVGTVDAEMTYIPLEYAEVISQWRDCRSCLPSRTSRFAATSDQSGRKVGFRRDVKSTFALQRFAFRRKSFPAERTYHGSTANSQMWKGQSLAYHQDPDAGPGRRYAMNHRNYNPQTGVFTSADPIKADSNLYRHLKNNPVNREDRSGLEGKTVWSPRVWLYTGSWSTTEDVWQSATVGEGVGYSENVKSAHQAIGALEYVPGAGWIARGTREALEGIQGPELTKQIESGKSQIDKTIEQPPELQQALPVVEEVLPFVPLLAGKPDARAANQLNQAAAAGKQNQEAIWGILSAINLAGTVGEGIARAEAGDGKSDAPPAEKLPSAEEPPEMEVAKWQPPKEGDPPLAAAAAILLFGENDDDEKD